LNPTQLVAILHSTLRNPLSQSIDMAVSNNKYFHSAELFMARRLNKPGHPMGIFNPEGVFKEGPSIEVPAKTK
jgi:hypothetical protein